MVAKKNSRPRPKKLSTRFKANPIATTKAEFKKLGPLGQIALIGVGAGIWSGSTSNKLNNLPLIGQVFSIFTSIGMKLKMQYK